MTIFLILNNIFELEIQLVQTVLKRSFDKAKITRICMKRNLTYAFESFLEIDFRNFQKYRNLQRPSRPLLPPIPRPSLVRHPTPQPRSPRTFRLLPSSSPNSTRLTPSLPRLSMHTTTTLSRPHRPRAKPRKVARNPLQPERRRVTVRLIPAPTGRSRGRTFYFY